MSLPVTEDTPPDMLAGSMDLNVVLPNGKTVKMSVQRGTPMMDLLVQATTTHCMSPGDYSLQAMGDKGVLPFKPSTPIGALDTFTVKIVEKKSQCRGRAPQVPQSFLNTFRLQVHLPRSQLFVLRVTPDVTLYDIMTHICTEKNLNFEKYEFRNTAKINEVLELDKTLGYYKVQELSLVSKGNRTVTGLMSSADMINVKSSKHRQNSVCDSSLSSGSFGSRSGSPVPALNVVTAPPQPPIRKKRRPAPKPPSFVEKEPVKKDRNFSSVLISHSRESSDSSGYHEASVLSESPTHGGPIVGLGDGSSPDTLPRRSKLPSSQSFTNLTSIQPAPKGRLITSISNTSLNSNGCSRKKRAPPPPPLPMLPAGSQSQKPNESRKASTLPISIAEEMRNGHGFAAGSGSFASAKVDDDDDDEDDNDVPANASDAKVQIPIEITSRINNKTKDSKNEPALVKDVDIRVPPKPKPRTLVVFRHQSEATAAEKPRAVDVTTRRKVVVVKRASLTQRSCLNNLEEEEGCESEDSRTGNTPRSPPKIIPRCKKSDGRVRCGESLGTCEEKNVPALDNVDQTDHDSINWEYQLPPPPTDFRDSNSPNCTESGTITITPEVLERVEPYKKIDVDGDWEPKKYEQSASRSDKVNGNGHLVIHNDYGGGYDGSRCHVKKTSSSLSTSSSSSSSQNKSDVMNELTNVMNIESRKQKEKSLSVSNLYTRDQPVFEAAERVKKSSQLNYSRSFSKEPVIAYLKEFNEAEDTRCWPREFGNNRKYEGGYSDDEDSRSEEITYRNYKNLEKSTSLECINAKRSDHYPVIGTQGKSVNGNNVGDEDIEGVFKKPVAPIQKKLKMARRSASSIGTNSRKRVPQENGRQTMDGESWADDPSLNVLRQQFLEFLKERKLMNSDLSMKSLDVICNILPEVVNVNGNHNVEDESGGNSISTSTSVSDNENEVLTRDPQPSSKEVMLQKISHEPAQKEKERPKEDKVKIVDVTVKDPMAVLNVKKSVETPKVEKAAVADKPEIKKQEINNRVPEEILRREKSPQKQEVSKRYSYQGPPSINFGTWGERPKTATKIIIKDEDYVTRDKVTERKTRAIAENGLSQTTAPTLWTEEKVTEAKPEVKLEKRSSLPVTATVTKNASVPAEKPKEVKKTQIIIKKPGVLSHYEMFSALPKRKEITSLKFFMEEEERKRASQQQQQQLESNRTVPVVCGIELKKEFKETEIPVTKPCSFSSFRPASSHSVSVYVNGNRGDEKDKVETGLILPKRNPSLMPVVKGFRSVTEDNPPRTGSNAQTVFQSSENWRSASKFATGPPQPPSVTSIKLKANGFEPCRPAKSSSVPAGDTRTQLLDEIRNFGGLRKLKKSTAY